MLETVREFVAERLAARPDIIEIGRRHAGYYGAQPSRPTGRCAAPDRASGWSGWTPRRGTWPPRCAGTWPMTAGASIA
jgi:hypothetical protein